LLGVKNAETPLAGETSILVQILKEDCKPICISDWSVLCPGTNLCGKECFTFLDVSHFEPSLVVISKISCGKLQCLKGFNFIVFNIRFRCGAPAKLGLAVLQALA